jgi:tRNA A-37 threonylcarbamoyl transferase component Bud32
LRLEGEVADPGAAGPLTDAIAELNDSLIGRYLVEKQIGQGGMATVYLARDVRHDRKVAIKVLHPELAAVLGPERFVTEMKVTANLQHPHILPLFDSGTARSQLFYVMPFVEGESLRDKLTREQQLPIDEAVRITCEVANALDYAHRHGVVHRDIKPENILLHDGTALVADFGIALAVSNAGGTRLTQTGLSLGTPQYMSPEQATGDRNVDGRTDVYSLGCVLYEMLTGEPPFTGPNSQAIVARVLTEAVRPIRARRDTVPQSVEDSVLKAVQKLPADRFATPGAFVDALRSSTTSASRSAPIAGHRPRYGFRLSYLTVVVVVGIVAFMWGRRSTAAAGTGVSYTGELLGGSQVAMLPRLSPDGRTLAFVGLVGRQSQIGVLNPTSGAWRILSRDTTLGLAESPAWAPDGSRLYFDRFAEGPRGIYSVSPTGEGDERLILPDACSPYPLSDGSLLFLRFNADRNYQLHRYYPQSGKVDTLPLLSGPACYGGPTMIDVLPGEREAIVVGGRGRDRTADTMYAINLSTRNVRVLWAGGGPAGFLGLRVATDGRSIVVARIKGDEFVVAMVPGDGSNRTVRRLATTARIFAIDVGPDGSIYVDQGNRPVELLQYSPATGQVERTALPTDAFGGALPLPDGRILTLSRSGGTSRIMVRAPGKEPVEFLASGERSQLPVAMLGPDRVMIRTGGDSGLALTIAYVATGRIAGRIPGFNHDVFAGSPDGKTIYYADSGAIWAVPSSGGPGRRIHPGDAVAPDPHGQYLVIQVIDGSGVHLLHVSLDGAVSQEIPVHSQLPIANTALTPNAVAPDGRILVEVGSLASWFWPTAILDPRTGSLTMAPELVYDSRSGWGADGRVVATSESLESTIWRFRPLTAGPKQ